jgi:hypothetical protein
MYMYRKKAVPSSQEQSRANLDHFEVGLGVHVGLLLVSFTVPEFHKRLSMNFSTYTLYSQGWRYPLAKSPMANASPIWLTLSWFG